MATTYEETTTTHSSSDGIGFDKPYLTSPKGLLKIAEIVSLVKEEQTSSWLIL